MNITGFVESGGKKFIQIWVPAEEWKEWQDKNTSGETEKSSKSILMRTGLGQKAQ